MQTLGKGSSFPKGVTTHRLVRTTVLEGLWVHGLVLSRKRKLRLLTAGG